MTGSKYSKTSPSKVVKKAVNVIDLSSLTPEPAALDSAFPDCQPLDSSSTPIYIVPVLPWRDRVCGLLEYSPNEAIELLENEPDSFETELMLKRINRKNHVKDDPENCDCSLCFPNLHEIDDDEDCPGCVSCHEDLCEENMADSDSVPAELDGVTNLSNIFCTSCIQLAIKNGGFCHLCCKVLNEDGQCDREWDRISNAV